MQLLFTWSHTPCHSVVTSSTDLYCKNKDKMPDTNDNSYWKKFVTFNCLEILLRILHLLLRHMLCIEFTLAFVLFGRRNRGSNNAHLLLLSRCRRRGAEVEAGSPLLLLHPMVQQQQHDSCRHPPSNHYGSLTSQPLNSLKQKQYKHSPKSPQSSRQIPQLTTIFKNSIF